MMLPSENTAKPFFRSPSNMRVKILTPKSSKTENVKPSFLAFFGLNRPDLFSSPSQVAHPNPSDIEDVQSNPIFLATTAPQRTVIASLVALTFSFSTAVETNRIVGGSNSPCSSSASSYPASGGKPGLVLGKSIPSVDLPPSRKWSRSLARYSDRSQGAKPSRTLSEGTSGRKSRYASYVDFSSSSRLSGIAEVNHLIALYVVDRSFPKASSKILYAVEGRTSSVSKSKARKFL
mmetsp:Transcript_22541/g.32460  ORF Transcript_22541/g.32460 Transcript_22541/m.32460 type:complete len:234 (-) Transcript_22541:241-942(-)